jgi:hypothetical protein
MNSWYNGAAVQILGCNLFNLNAVGGFKLVT